MPDSSSGPATVDACALLTDAEIEAATRVAVASREPSRLIGWFSSSCDIGLEGGSLTVSILPEGGREMWERSFAITIGTGSTEAVPDLGDAAARTGESYLMVLKDDVLFDVDALVLDASERLAAVQYLAEIVLAKLPCLAEGCPNVSLPPAPSLAPAFDACTLLTVGEIEDATGLPATVETPPSGPSDRCLWRLDTGSTFSLENIMVTVVRSGGRDRWDTFYASSSYPKVPGLGDDAVRTGGNAGGTIEVVVGDQLLTVSYELPPETADPEPVLVPLVTTAISRLPG
jgi:hypothetical protein